MRPVRTSRAAHLASLGVAAAIALTGCAADNSTPNPEPERTDAEQPAPEPDPTFDPNGGAEANKAFFDKTLQDMLAEDDKADSHKFVDTLAAAGFDKSRMEVTFDRTTIDLEADYIIVSVKMPDNKCLIGQRSSRGYASIVADPMSTGRCLIGKTQPISW